MIDITCISGTNLLKKRALIFIFIFIKVHSTLKVLLLYYKVRFHYRNNASASALEVSL